MVVGQIVSAKSCPNTVQVSTHLLSCLKLKSQTMHNNTQKAQSIS